MGALARNIWFVKNDKSARGTKDIDFAVFMPDAETYNKLKQILVNEYAYTLIRENAFCLIAPNGTQIDLLPFGAIEQQERVIIEGKGLTTIRLDGFKETYNLGLVEVDIVKGIS